jgi:endonuclease/exonuclease/phosphatase family metal-dependent hydrolase
LFSTPPFDVADAFLVQEIEDHGAEPGSRAARVAAATGMAFVYLPAKMVNGGTQGVAIFSRRRLANVRFMNLPFFGTSIRSDHRVALAVEIDGLDVVNLHLFLQLGIAERILQLGPATEDLLPVALIGGDFNTNPYAWGDMLPVVVTDPITNVDVARVVDDAMAEFGFDAATRASGATHNAPGTNFRLDSIYTRGLEVGAPRVERSVSLSDHWPLWVDVDR